jgi:hypothetical protein
VVFKPPALATKHAAFRNEDPAMTRFRVLPFAIALWAITFAFAFVAAPRSCEWGLSAYFWSGLATLAVLFALPWMVEQRTPLRRPVLAGLSYAGIGLVVWTGGLFAANVRILCRLF